MKPRDAFIASFGDFHSGGLTALFPDYKMYFEYDKKNILPYEPTNYQASMYGHFMACAALVKERGRNKRKVIVMNGDATENSHHGTAQLISPSLKHHCQIHIELMEQFVKASGFSVKNGDELHYVSGTESHTGWEEYGIKKHFDALGAQYHDELKLTINGKRLWWVHQGPNPGKGVNEGNPLRNFARDIYWDCLKINILPPHLVTCSHFHKAAYDSYNQGYDHAIHIQVLPSWQMKTRFGIAASGFQRNDIGMTFNEVTINGDLRITKPFLWQDIQ